MARIWIGLAAVCFLAGCSVGSERAARLPSDAGSLQAPSSQPADDRLPLQQAARNFVAVIGRVEPMAEAVCRQSAPSRNCDFQIGVEMDPAQPPNAYQTVDEAGRPQIVFTISLIAEARNADELAFVLGHESAHHIEGHLAQSEQEALAGAIIGGILASATGGTAAEIERAQQFGARVGALRFSKEHELEADRLGTIIAYEAGYDPVLGAAFFARLPDPGYGFLNSHPANAQRQAVVAKTYALISGG